MPLKVTPFHPRTAPLCESQAWRRWAGFQVASSYELLHEREYHAIRSSAALLDVSPLYKYLVTGKDAARLLHRIITRDVENMKVGQVVYTPWCDATGKVIDDGTVSRLDERVFRMTAADPNIRWLHLNARGLDVKIEEVSESTAALALQGPNSRAILQQLSDTDLAGLKYFRLTRAKLRGIPVTVSRTGYTGDLGYEVWVDAAQAVPLWDALIDAGTPYGITPCGMLGLDMARIEAGLMLLEVDYFSAHHALIESQKSSPFELNLAWTVNLKKEWFVGKAALVEEAARGPAWQFVGLEVAWDSLERLYAEVGLPPRLPTAAWRTSVPVYMDGAQAGYATSGVWSPLLKKYRAAARVVPTPFFNPERKRA